MSEKEWSVLTCLPDQGKRVLCYGYKTYCCEQDMEEERQWHEVTFDFHMCSYKLKKEIPEHPDESILEWNDGTEAWSIGEDFCDGRVIGVTKWKHLPIKLED